MSADRHTRDLADAAHHEAHDHDPPSRRDLYLEHCDRTDGPLVRRRCGFKAPPLRRPDIDETDPIYEACMRGIQVGAQLGRNDR